MQHTTAPTSAANPEKADRVSKGTARAIVAHDQERRRDAARAGTPVDRMRAPGILGYFDKYGTQVDEVLVWANQHGILLAYMDGATPAPVRLTMKALDKALALPLETDADGRSRFPALERPRRLVVADTQTLRRIIGWTHTVAQEANDEIERLTALTVHRRVLMASRLTLSTRVVTLTRALARRFWLPTGLDPEEVGSWRTAFGIGTRVETLAAMKRLTVLAGDGVVNTDWANTAFESESYALSSARFAGLRSAVAAYKRFTKADTAGRTILTADPLLLERGALDGTVSRLRMLNVHTDSFTASVSMPFKLRAGKQIMLIDTLDPGAAASHQVTILDAVNIETIAGVDQMTVTVRGSEYKSALGTFLNRVARRADRTLYVTEAPYLPRGRASMTQRWTQQSVARIAADADRAAARNDVPLDVIVAGAPGGETPGRP